MPDTRPLEISAGLDRWHPNEMTEWLAGIEDDETVADDHRRGSDPSRAVQLGPPARHTAPATHGGEPVRGSARSIRTTQERLATGRPYPGQPALLAPRQ